MSDYLTRAATQPKIRVWDIGVRLFHWSLVASVAVAYLVAEQRSLHRWLGYAVIGLIAFRLFWGLVGTRHARFINFVPGPRRFIGYLVDMVKGREARHLGHNPAGGAMIVGLLINLAAIGATGYMLGMDAYFGVEWVERAHKLLVNVLLVMVPLHILGVVVSSLRHRENLVLAMVTGNKAADEENPV